MLLVLVRFSETITLEAQDANIISGKICRNFGSYDQQKIDIRWKIFKLNCAHISYWFPRSNSKYK